MQRHLRNFLIKPILALAIAMPVVTTVNIGDAEARHKKYRGAIIAGAIIGGAIAYHHYKRRKHRKYRHYGYVNNRRWRNYRHHHHRRHGYYHRHGHYGHVHFHYY